MIELTTEQVVQIHAMIDMEAKPDFRIEGTNLRRVIAVTPMDNPACGDGIGATVLIDSDGRTAVIKDDQLLPG